MLTMDCTAIAKHAYDSMIQLNHSTTRALLLGGIKTGEMLDYEHRTTWESTGC